MWKRCGVVAAALAVAILSTGCYWLARSEEKARPAILEPRFVLRVNAGASEAYTDKAGNVWQADKMYTKGGGYGFVGEEFNTVDRGTDVKIEGTPDPRIYQLERWLMEKFVAEVPNGEYTVRLHFAETFPEIDTEGPRVFDVKIQGIVAMKDFNLSKAAGGVQTAFIHTAKGVEVTEGILEISFTPNQQNPEINGIEIIAE